MMHQSLSTFSPTYLPSRFRLLAILGNSQGINLTEDEQSLKNLPYVEIEWLKEPSRQELHSMLHRKKWDILFFAGHSSSEEDLTTGNIAINSQNSLNLHQFKHTLRDVQQNGLKLAIFNSCDGLGLANALVDLRIPYIIVMREPVPDQVAQNFLQFFLESFSTGISLYKAFRQARKKLESLEYPGAIQIPVIVQHPTAQPLIWPQYQPSRVEQFVTLILKQYLRITLTTVLLVGLVTSVFILSPYSEFLCEPIGNCNTRVMEHRITKTLGQVNNLNDAAQSIAEIEEAKKILNSIADKINTLSPENEVYIAYINMNNKLYNRLGKENNNQQLLTEATKVAQKAIDDINQYSTVDEMKFAVTQLRKSTVKLQEITSKSLFNNRSKKLQQKYEEKIKDFNKQIEDKCKYRGHWQPKC
ncbi:MAG: CHAT domain-containing protein [Symploca sp. SIO3E6]|nr:CHAT domain-containing protein [Caldora sp. SIO3E6]